MNDVGESIAITIGMLVTVLAIGFIGWCMWEGIFRIWDQVY